MAKINILNNVPRNEMALLNLTKAKIGAKVWKRIWSKLRDKVQDQVCEQVGKQIKFEAKKYNKF